jgi:hypothetical protein
MPTGILQGQRDGVRPVFDLLPLADPHAVAVGHRLDRGHRLQAQLLLEARVMAADPERRWPNDGLALTKYLVPELSVFIQLDARAELAVRAVQPALPGRMQRQAQQQAAADEPVQHGAAPRSGYSTVAKRYTMRVW